MDDHDLIERHLRL